MSWRDDVRVRLGAALIGRAPRRVALRLPAGALSWRAAWTLAEDQDAYLWSPPEGPRRWGLGTAARVAPEAGLAGARRALERWETAGDALPAPPFFVALPFDGPTMADPWGPFAPGVLALPRIVVAETPDETLLWVLAEDPAAEADAIQRTLARLCAPAAELGQPPSGTLRSLETDPVSWAQAIEAALAEIAAGHLEKVVVARAARYQASAPLDPVHALARLAEAQPRCAIFGLRQRGATFLGATPERLLLRRGRQVRTDAVAGTGADAAALLASEKDRREHQIVVDTIADALAPRCSTLRWPPTPEVLPLAHLCHLRTRFDGQLHGEDDALSLAGLLHPTPAVGGLPREAALRTIAGEPAPRGLYAGPVGWVDEDGDGELWVALRSGVLRGRDLTLFAGVGVVVGSEPAAEWAETERKLRTMEAAFSP